MDWCQICTRPSAGKTFIYRFYNPHTVPPKMGISSYGVAIVKHNPGPQDHVQNPYHVKQVSPYIAAFWNLPSLNVLKSISAH